MIAPFLLSLVLNRYVLGGLVVAGLATGAYFKGYEVAASKCREAELRAELATMKRDIEAWKAADAMEKELQHEVDMERERLQQKVSEYEVELAARPDNRCTLGPDDIRGLRFK